MDRRELLGALGAAVGVASLAGVDARAADEPAHHHHTDKVHEDCVQACGQCALSCNMTAHHCLDKLAEGQGSAKLHARAHALAMDCQAFCVLSATMIARGSELMAASCEACADACQRCAEACEKAPQDDRMRDCVKKCRDCEKSCREMVRHMKAGADASR